MRTFKIIVITLLMLAAAGLALYWIQGMIPSSSGPDEESFDEIYHEHDDEAPDTDELFEQTPKQLEGVIKPLGISIYQEGSHRLENNDTLIALLESETLDLDDYLESEVKVTGVVRDTVEGAQSIMKVNLVEEVKPSGVESFNDVSYEFSFDYPADWKVKKDRDKVTFYMTKEGEDENLVIVYQYPDNEGSLETWLADRDQNLFFEETQVKVGEGTGVRRTISNGDQQIIKTYGKAKSTAYEIRLVSQDETIRSQYFSIVDGFVTAFAIDEEISAPEEIQEEPPADDTPAEETAEETKEDEATPEEPEEVPEEVEEEVQADDEEKDAEETTTTSEESQETFTDLEPLTADQIQRVVDKGLTPFEGRNLNFSYPSPWYFSYISEDGAYGFTDEASYKGNDEEIAVKNSRVLLIVGSTDLECSTSIEKKLDTTTYTLCAREPGLSELVQKIADTIVKPAAE